MWLRRQRHVAIAHCAHDTDDRQTVRVAARPHTFADRLGALPVATGQCLVDDTDVETRRVVAGREVAAIQQRNTDSLEVARANRRAASLTLALGRRSPFDHKSIGVTPRVDRQRAGEARTLNSRYRSHQLE